MIFWQQSNNHIYHREMIDGSWDNTVDWLDESANTLANDRSLNALLNSTDFVKNAIIYSSKKSSPYSIDFAAMIRGLR